MRKLLLASLLLTTKVSTASTDSNSSSSFRMTYVMDPFEEIGPYWFVRSPQLATVSLSSSHNKNDDDANEVAVYGNSSALISITLPPAAAVEEAASESQLDHDVPLQVGWVHPSRAHNCRGADHISFWYKYNFQVHDNSDGDDETSVLPEGREMRLRMYLLDDATCWMENPTKEVVADNSSPAEQAERPFYCQQLSSSDVEDEKLDSHLLTEILLQETAGTDGQGEWQHIRVPVEAMGSLQLSRIRGWKLEVSTEYLPVDGSNSPTSTEGHLAGGSTTSLWLDHLECEGDGALLGAPMVSPVVSMDALIEDESLQTQYHLSNVSEENSDFSFIPGTEAEDETPLSTGGLSLNYTIEQVECWGGFVDVGLFSTTPGYFNFTGATHLVLDYFIHEPSSQQERAIFRFVLNDASDCNSTASQCDSEYHDVERHYSFHAVLDNRRNSSGQIVLPLVGSEEPSTPLWLTGWSGQLGNKILDIDKIQGYTLELALDSQLGYGGVVSGHVELTNLRAVVLQEDRQMQDDDAVCVQEDQLEFKEDMPGWTRLEFLGSSCCEKCHEDPECLYAMSTGRDCFLGSRLHKDFARLRSSEEVDQEDGSMSFWMDDATKRGDFCSICACHPDQAKIDCRGKKLRVLPKMFSGSFTPRILDLRDNPELLLVGSGALEVLSASITELYLPNEVAFISMETVDAFASSVQIMFESENGNHTRNAISSDKELFSDICCDIGNSSNTAGDLFFCDLQKQEPGVDSVYLPFEKFINPASLSSLLPSSDFLSEAAESVEKCAEVCTIQSDCNYFTYDARLNNAEHICFLYTSMGDGREEVCCDDPDFADKNGTQPGLTSGIPPRTRHKQLNASVITKVQNPILSQENHYSTTFSLSLGANPLRGAVWVELGSTADGAALTFEPQRVALYHANQQVEIKAVLSQADASADRVSTAVVSTLIQSCDIAFLEGDESGFIFLQVQRSDPSRQKRIVVATICALLTLVIVLGAVTHGNLRSKRQNDSLWLVKREELHFDSPPTVIGQGTFGLVLLAEYRGTNVAVKRAAPPRKNVSKHYSHMDPTATAAGSVVVGNDVENGSRSLLSTQRSTASSSRYQSTPYSQQKWGKLKADFVKEMRTMSKLRHPCITTVMGAVLSKDVEPMLIMEYMDHGSLYDLLQNKTMILEGDIVLQILRDISQGMRFLHASDPQVVHGDIKAANILVDRKFRAKVADFGLTQKRTLGATGSPYWMAPELLRGESTNSPDTDVYSFGVVLVEVYSRKDPYEGEDPDEVLRLVADRAVNKRPRIPPGCPPEVMSLISSCLHDEADQRPSTQEIDNRLRRVNAQQVAPTNDKIGNSASMSLYDMFPVHVADALSKGEEVEPEHRDEVTIFFSDIVSFTTLSATLQPRKVANMLNRLYSTMDELTAKHDLYKLETVGDSYVAVANLVKDQPHDHAERIALFAQDSVIAANQTLIDVDNPKRGCLNIRAGFHTGPVVADVVGTRNRKYALFGDTINTASRMESTSKSNRIQCSVEAASILQKQCPSIPIASRGQTHIKGKGMLETFWVHEENQECTPRPLQNRKPLTDLAMLEWAAADAGKSRHTRSVGDVESLDGESFTDMSVGKATTTKTPTRPQKESMTPEQAV